MFTPVDLDNFIEQFRLLLKAAYRLGAPTPMATVRSVIEVAS
jgi:hypothetical protein